MTWWVKFFGSKSHQLQELPGSAIWARHHFSSRNVINVGRTDRMTDTFPRITAVFFLLYKSSKTLPVTTFLLSGPVMLLCGLKCGTFLFWRVKDLFGCQSVNSSAWTLLICASVLPLLRLWYYLWRRTGVTAKLSPLSTSVTFTQMARWGITAWRNSVKVWDNVIPTSESSDIDMHMIEQGSELRSQELTQEACGEACIVRCEMKGLKLSAWLTGW